MNQQQHHINDSISRSPSPPTAPPIPAAPGPRATALQKLYTDAITHVLKTCSYTNFSACFPTLAAQVPGSLRLLHEQFTQKLGEGMRREFGVLVEERRVVGCLNELDGLVGEARRRRKGRVGDGESEGEKIPVPPHTLPAQQLYLAYLAPSLSQHSSALQQRQDVVQAENIDLLSRVMQQRKDIESLVKGLESAVGDLDASVATLQRDGEDGQHGANAAMDVEALRDDVRDVDEDMRMTA